jgi:hypothetical protein
MKGNIQLEDQVQSIEMSLNKEDIMCKSIFMLILVSLVDKSKLVIVRLHKLYVVIPFTITKIEIRVRNVLINIRPKLAGIAAFVQFYLDSNEEARRTAFDPA